MGQPNNEGCLRAAAVFRAQTMGGGRGGLLEGTDKRLRHVKVYDRETAESPAVRALIEAALAERREALGR